MGDHVYPGAVPEATHDGTWATVDLGIVRRPCPRCDTDHVHRLVEPEDRHGVVVGYGVVACHECRWEHELDWDEYDRWPLAENGGQVGGQE